MEFLVIPQLSRTIIECYSAGSDSDDCRRFECKVYNSGECECFAGRVCAHCDKCNCKSPAYVVVPCAITACKTDCPCFFLSYLLFFIALYLPKSRPPPLRRRPAGPGSHCIPPPRPPRSPPPPGPGARSPRRRTPPPAQG